jgi:alpha-L-rhamnosidase
MMEMPNCIDVSDPLLSWINDPINDDIKGAGQSAYRIRVASSRNRLAKADLWDSKKVMSDESVFV